MKLLSSSLVLTSLCAMAMLVSCGKSDSQNIIGTWKRDDGGYMKFTADKKVVTGMNDPDIGVMEFTGTWSLEDGKLKLAIPLEEGEDPVVSISTVEFNGDQLSLTDEEGKDVFTRSK